jgi:single-strand DNA-binding protein
MNACNFIGRVGKDAVLRHTQAGKAVLGWSIAVDRGFGDNKQTIWIDCALWGDRGSKIADYVRKGDRIGVCGELGTREHDGKTYLTLDVRDVTLLGNKTDRDESPRDLSKRQNKPDSAPAADPLADDEIPF